MLFTLTLINFILKIFEFSKICIKFSTLYALLLVIDCNALLLKGTYILYHISDITYFFISAQSMYSYRDNILWSSLEFYAPNTEVPIL